MIVLAIIGLLAAIAIPSYVRARIISDRTACINNLRQIDAAIGQYAMENNRAATAPVAEGDVTPYLKHPVVCPAGGTRFPDRYPVTACKTQPTCISSGGKAANGHVLPSP